MTGQNGRVEIAMQIEVAQQSDYAYLVERDRHLAASLVARKIQEHEIFIFRDAGRNVGWMRHGYFWDNTPFMNMIWIDEPYRGKGLGKQAVLHWENLMRRQGFNLAMTSTLANEHAQHFYRSLGYRDAGCLLLENEPLEIILIKSLHS